MKMVRRVNKEVEEVSDIICNRCERSLKSEDPTDGGFYGLVEIAATGGFNSPILEDETAWRFSLCEFCLGDLASEFRIPPEKLNLESLVEGSFEKA